MPSQQHDTAEADRKRRQAVAHATARIRGQEAADLRQQRALERATREGARTVAWLLGRLARTGTTLDGTERALERFAQAQARAVTGRPLTEPEDWRLAIAATAVRSILAPRGDVVISLAAGKAP